VLLLNGQDPYGPPGAAAFLPRDQALATARALADCQYVPVPGNHITMLYGDQLHLTIDAITAFVRDEQDPVPGST
jgi:hypothetical protein